MELLQICHDNLLDNQHQQQDIDQCINHIRSIYNTSGDHTFLQMVANVQNNSRLNTIENEFINEHKQVSQCFRTLKSYHRFVKDSRSNQYNNAINTLQNLFDKVHIQQRLFYTTDDHHHIKE